MTIYEWDADKVSGAQLKSALDAIDAPDQIRKQAIEGLRRVRVVQRRIRRDFGVVRNATIAHRDADALVQYRAIRYLDSKQAFILVGEFYDAVREFLDVLPVLVQLSGEPSALMRQWLLANK